METTVLVNGRIFTPGNGDEADFNEAMIVAGDKIRHVGCQEDEIVRQALLSGARRVDLGNKVVVPGFIDSHMHILDFALSQRKLSLLHCRSLAEIQASIQEYANKNPSEPRVLCKGWIQSTTDGEARAAWLDDLDPRPIYIQANDMHSGWASTAAMEEIGIPSMADPPGGKIHRDADGRPTGLLSEAAHLDVVNPWLNEATPVAQKLQALRHAVAEYTAAGYTGMIDMAMEETQWAVLESFRQQYAERFPFHIAAHWIIPYSKDASVVQGHLQKAIEMHGKYHSSKSPTFCIVGIKLICDGVVDGCTAALFQPYTGTQDPVDPIWPEDELEVVARKADEAGLQCAIHAIGDKAVHQAVNVLSRLTPGRRHRIEHLELTSPEDAKRLGKLGITASVQPVHSDPALFRAWPGLVGPHRCNRAFAYREFLEGGAPMALGSDSPTAAHLALQNLYNATTRRSAIELGSTETVNDQFKLSLAAAVTAATTGAAYSRHADSWTGSLVSGHQADFVVLDMEWNPNSLLQAKVQQTWSRGMKVFDAAQKNIL
ncbi:amidohydrolase 3 [Aspergillus ambiguus]|uniref:amidohydrolase n=1 Tax=Aspergillus ambiguus TaxID=176160 RepID=UPI003CCC9CD3